MEISSSPAQITQQPSFVGDEVKQRTMTKHEAYKLDREKQNRSMHINHRYATVKLQIVSSKIHYNWQLMQYPYSYLFGTRNKR